ncbi:hypothetical protein [Pseudorhodobacter sp. E13]|uniref:hypothetical protein n=1 Tax=Pseudorhodobacter sp. E13 TaxID=2487931 RepID=UPI001315172B|nr:hypothetical protein [Pseudorhodobacter sp. E13]
MLRLLVIALVWPLAGFAQSADVSEGLRARILAKPDRFESVIAGLILGYGNAEGLSAQGVENYLAVERSKVRVREMRRLMLADLDDDGTVTQAELFVVMSAQGASARGSLWQAHSAADKDADGAVTWAELHSQSRAVAARSAADEATLRSVMELDFDSDGFVSMQELREAVTLIAPRT